MIIPKNEQEARDYDWFGVDGDGHVAHFTTAGCKYLPGSIGNSAEDLQRVTDYFDNEAPVLGAHKVDLESLAAFRGYSGEPDARYLASFVAMADKGLFSYDIETYVRPGIAYSRVAIPLCPIGLPQLPDDVRAIVERTVLKVVCFDAAPKVDYADTLSA